MTVRVGVIGAGMMGQDHIRRISRVLTGGAVVAVNDVDAARAGQVGAGLPGAAGHATAQDLIGDGDVDAGLVASWGPAHEEQVLAAIGAGKPVFCEKPLAPSSGACLRIVDAEVAQGRRTDTMTTSASDRRSMSPVPSCVQRPFARRLEFPSTRRLGQ